jgi:hypothetical protein
LSKFSLVASRGFSVVFVPARGWRFLLGASGHIGALALDGDVVGVDVNGKDDIAVENRLFGIDGAAVGVDGNVDGNWRSGVAVGVDGNWRSGVAVGVNGAAVGVDGNVDGNWRSGVAVGVDGNWRSGVAVGVNGAAVGVDGNGKDDIAASRGFSVFVVSARNWRFLIGAIGHVGAIGHDSLALDGGVDGVAVGVDVNGKDDIAVENRLFGVDGAAVGVDGAGDAGDVPNTFNRRQTGFVPRRDLLVPSDGYSAGFFVRDEGESRLVGTGVDGSNDPCG